MRNHAVYCTTSQMSRPASQQLPYGTAGVGTLGSALAGEENAEQPNCFVLDPR